VVLEPSCGGWQLVCLLAGGQAASRQAGGWQPRGPAGWSPGGAGAWRAMGGGLVGLWGRGLAGQWMGGSPHVLSEYHEVEKPSMS
jgi:hypothetical protein